MSRFFPLRLLLGLTLVCATAVPLQAHHGNEFLLLEDYELPEVWRGHLATGVDWEKYGSLNTYSTESMFFMSIAPQVALSVSTGFNDEESSWRYAAVTPRLHVQLTPPDWDLPLRIGVSFGYQFVDGAAGYGTKRVRVVTYETQDCGCSGKKSTVTVTKTTSSPSSGGVVTPPCDPLVDVDCPAPSPAPKHAGHPGTTTSHTTVTTTSASSGGGKSKVVRKVTYVTVPEAPGAEPTGIHNHDENLWTGRVVAELDLGATKVLFNLLGIAPEGRGPSWGYAAGVRHQFTHSFSMGVESIGDFDREGLHEVVLGCYFSPAHNLTVKIGAGFGLTEVSPDFALRTGLLWRF